VQETAGLARACTDAVVNQLKEPGQSVIKAICGDETPKEEGGTTAYADLLLSKISIYISFGECLK
jgi:hypothetical protein